MDSFTLQLSVVTPDCCISDEDIQRFQNYIYKIYQQHKRSFPWRDIQNPYHIVVSEIMLQQTQVLRVVTKYNQFLERFPTIQALAAATLHDVLAIWVGLGYNRRGAALRRIAQIVVEKYGGVIPQDAESLIKLPGIGPNTVGSIQAFAFNMPSVFIETNIRSVMLYTWFRNQEAIDDRMLMPLIRQTVDAHNARTWYYALMDYGALLKKHTKNPSRKSKHYGKQSVFKGSDRQIRGIIIRQLSQCVTLTWQDIVLAVNDSEERIKRIMSQLLNEKLVYQSPDALFAIAGNDQHHIS